MWVMVAMLMTNLFQLGLGCSHDIQMMLMLVLKIMELDVSNLAGYRCK